MFAQGSFNGWWNWLMKKEFYCKGNQLANYLIKNGSVLLRTENKKGSVVYVFEYDESIDRNIDQYETDKRKWLF